MIVVGIFVIAALALVAGTVWLVHLGFRAGNRAFTGGLHRRIDTAATCRWEDLGRLSRLP